MLPWVCLVIDHRRRQNVVKTAVTRSNAALVPLTEQTHGNMESMCQTVHGKGIMVVQNFFWSRCQKLSMKFPKKKSILVYSFIDHRNDVKMLKTSQWNQRFAVPRECEHFDDTSVVDRIKEYWNWLALLRGQCGNQTHVVSQAAVICPLRNAPPKIGALRG